MEKNLEYYLSLPYPVEIIPDLDEDNLGWVARVVDLPGCLTQADTFEELEEMIADAKYDWLAVALENGTPIPEPKPAPEYSGKFVVRLPKSLHRELVAAAEQEGVSLNAYINVALAKAVGQAMMVTYPVLDQPSTLPRHSFQRVSKRPPENNGEPKAD